MDAHRGRNFAISGHDGGALRSVENSDVNSMGCKADFVGRGYGIEGPRDVIAAELLDRQWDEIESDDGVRSYVSNLPKPLVR